MSTTALALALLDPLPRSHPYPQSGPLLEGTRLRPQVRGQYVLQVPGTSFVIDGASENSPFECARSLATYANHSSRPNARIESWPVLRPGALEVRQHMMLVAIEHIESGQEVRINNQPIASPHTRLRQNGC